MCTSIIEIVRAQGMAKRGDEWFTLSQAVVAYDHARHAPLGDVITLDFINIGLDPGGISPISSRKTVPSSACSINPRFCVRASVKAPRS